LTVEPLHCSRSHFLFSKAHRLFIPHGGRADSNPISTMSLEEALKERVQKGTTVIECH
jgi:hypothetical protein